MDSNFECLRVEASGDGLVTVTIDRPRALNALNDATIADIDRCFAALADDSSARVIVVTGAGERAFVAGADITELADQGVRDGRTRSAVGQRAFGRIEQLGKPVIAAINGFALGGGLELALACHLRFASSSAKLGLPEVGLSIIPGFGGTQRLQRLVGRGRALEWILTGATYSAEEAHRIGVVNGVFSPETLRDEVNKVARTLLRRGPLALEHALEAVLRGGDTSLSEGLRIEADLFGTISASADMREGMKAFLEKRAPDFKGA